MRFNSIYEMNSTLIKCKRCPRLVRYRVEVASKRKKFLGEKFWSKPVPGFGDIGSRLLILGLAPAATGGNRTGRVFTGDKSASFLFSCLYEVGISNLRDSVSIDDGLMLRDAYITAVLKCVPPNDKPDRNEMDNCSDYLQFEIESMGNLKAVLTLGSIAFDRFKLYLKGKGYDVRAMKFSHGKRYDVGGLSVYCSYHPSPRNVNTGKLRKDDMISLLKTIEDNISSS
ncbi:MAG: uracil-DNA glycosylase [Thermoplasmatales archaeon]